jgi:hypothetical protein
MTVPKAAVHEYGYAIFAQDEIGPAGKVGNLKSIAKASLKEGSSNFQFRASVTAPNAGHVTASGRRCEMIGHGSITKRSASSQ